jgi:hypothetical protein
MLSGLSGLDAGKPLKGLYAGASGAGYGGDIISWGLELMANEVLNDLGLDRPAIESSPFSNLWKFRGSSHSPSCGATS